MQLLSGKFLTFFPYPDPLLKKVEHWGKRGKRAVLGERFYFLNREGKINEWGNNDVADL